MFLKSEDYMKYIFVLLIVVCASCASTAKRSGSRSASFDGPGGSVDGNQDYRMKSYSEMVRGVFGG